MPNSSLTLEKLAKNIPGTLLVYKANETEDILFVSDDVTNLFECESVEEFMKFTGGSFSYLVYSEDIEDVNNVIHKQIESHQSSNDYVQYRIITRTGKIKTVEDWGRLVHDEELGDLYYVYLNDISEKEKLSQIASTKISRTFENPVSKSHEHTKSVNTQDELTGLLNSAGFKARGLNFIARIFDIGMQPSLIYFNIRNFHTYNEIYGNDGGDRMLKSIARILQDTFINSLIARIDGDHFVIITSKSDLSDRISRMTNRVNSIRMGSNVELKAGIYKIKTLNPDLASIFEAAKNACEKIKSEYGITMEICE